MLRRKSSTLALAACLVIWLLFGCSLATAVVAPTQTSTVPPAVAIATPVIVLSNTPAPAPSLAPSATPTVIQAPTDTPENTEAPAPTATATLTPTLAAACSPKILFLSNRSGSDALWEMNADGSNPQPAKEFTIETGILKQIPPGSAYNPGVIMPVIPPISPWPGYLHEALSQGTPVIQYTSQGANAATDTLPLVGRNPNSPAWSWDGKQFAYSALVNGFAQIFTYNLESKKVTQLTQDEGQHGGVAWSLDGSQIYYSAYTTSFSMTGGFKTIPPQIYVMNADGSNQHALSPTPASGFYPSLSPDGKLLVFAEINGTTQRVSEVSAGGGEVKPLTGSDLPGATNPSFSPDGSLIVFQGPGAKGQTAVFTIKPDGSGQKELLNDSFQNTLPVWEPCG